MSKTKKIAILAIIAMVLTLMPTALFAATADSSRLEGAGRIDTALDIASAGWTTASTVVLAPADDANLVDALAAAPLAGQENAPILLTFKGSLDNKVADKIKALGATKVYVIGAISADVAAAVDAIANVSVETLKGEGRQATATAVNAKLTNIAGTFVVGFDAVPDALSVASYAAKNKYKIVLANADGSVDSAALVGTKYIVGGTTKVKDIAGVTRLSGDNRFATNADVASKLSYSYDRVYVANGNTCVDALAVAPLAAKYNAFVALGSSTDVAAASVVNAKLSSSSKVIAVGGVNAVPAAVVGKVVATSTALQIVSVTAPTLGQIKVEFNKVVDKDSAIAATNYTLVAKNSGTATLTGATYTLSDDKKSVLIDLAASYENQKDYTLTVKDVKDEAGAKLSETSKDFLASDLMLPVVSKVEITGTKTIKVTMSEAVVATGGQDRVSFKLDNGALSAPTFAVGTTTQRNVITLTLAAELSAGAHSLTVANVKDFAGLYSVSADYPLNYSKDTTAPTVSIKEIKSDAKTVVLKFNKDIDGATLATANVKFSHTYSGSNEVTGNTGGVVTKKSASEYEILFANPLAPGSTSVFIKYIDGTTDSQKVKDLFGNNLVLPVTLTANITADVTAPTVTGVTQKDADEIYVNFSEDVNATDAQITGNYKLVNSKNETVSLTSATYVAADKRTTLKATANLEEGAYTLEVRNINDKAVVPNKMTTATFNVTVVDKVAPVVSVAAYKSADKKIIVKFSKDMASTGLTTLSNYALTVNGDAKSWPTGTAVSIKDSKTVEITLGASVTNLDGTTDNIQISGAFTSVAGVAIGGISVNQSIVASATVAPAYIAGTAKFTDKETITFELDSELQSIDATKIQFDGVDVASASYVNQGNKSVVTIKVAAGKVLATTNAATWAAQKVAYDAADAVVSTFGGANAGAADVVTGANIKDKAAPFIVSATTGDADGDNQIDTLTVVLSESVVGGTVAAADFSLSDSYSINSVTSVSANTVVLKINESGLADDNATPSISIAGAIEDLVGNVVSSGSAVVSIDGI